MSLARGLEHESQNALYKLSRGDSWISQRMEKQGQKGGAPASYSSESVTANLGPETARACIVPGTRGCTWCLAWCPRRNTAWHCQAARKWSQRRCWVPAPAAAARAACSPNGPQRPPSAARTPAAASLGGGGGGLHGAVGRRGVRSARTHCARKASAPTAPRICTAELLQTSDRNRMSSELLVAGKGC